MIENKIKINTNNQPFVSFIIPIYNSDKYLDLCLSSIVKQNYPKDKTEIICIDGGSTDNSLEILKKYSVKLLNNFHKAAEYGKAIGIRASRGKYFILLDSDNEIVQKDWLEKMIYIILDSPNLFGVESPLSYDKSLSSLNRYFAKMRIADPLARILASKPNSITEKNGYKILNFGKNDILITGANGFLWNKDLVNKIGFDETFEEANFSTDIHEKTNATYAIPYDISIKHYYCNSLLEYLNKRKKIGLKIKSRLQKNQKNLWIKKISLLKIFISSLYLVSFIGPTIESIYNQMHEHSLDWMWHPIISNITILSYCLTFIQKSQLKS